MGVVVEGVLEGVFAEDEVADLGFRLFALGFVFFLGFVEGVAGAIEAGAAVGAPMGFGGGVESADGAGDH